MAAVAVTKSRLVHPMAFKRTSVQAGVLSRLISTVNPGKMRWWDSSGVGCICYQIPDRLTLWDVSKRLSVLSWGLTDG